MDARSGFSKNKTRNSPVAYLLLLLIGGGLSALLLLGQPKCQCEEAYTSKSTYTLQTLLNDGRGLNRLTHAGDAAWRNLTTNHGGLLWVQSLRPEENEAAEKQGIEEWGISMFHALHCLQSIRKHLMEKRSSGGHDEGTPSQGEDIHIGHCLAYIAGIIECQGDSTLEPPQRRVTADGKLRTNVDGAGFLHQCRDTSMLWKAARQSEQAPIKPWEWWPGQRLEDLVGANPF